MAANLLSTKIVPVLIPTFASKKTFLFVLFISGCCIVKAQSFETNIGNFTAEDINLKECPFDKDADAVVISDEAISNFNDEYNLITQRKIKFKILKEKGIERANIKIRYYSDDNFEFISNIKAVIASFNDHQEIVTKEVNSKNIYKKQLNRLYSEVTFALPNVQVGSIIEYTYTSTMKSYSGLSDWYFQKDMPVMFSSYKLYILPNAEFAYTVYKKNDFPIKIKPDPKDGSVYYEMQNIPGLRDEIYMDAARDYLQRVNFQLSGFTNYYGKRKFSTTWPLLAQELLTEKMFGGQINKSISDIGVAKVMWESAPSPFTKMKLIHDYVRSNIVWNDVYSKYAENNIKEVVEKKKGNSGEINLILLNLLKDAGLEVYPLLVSERDNGRVDTTYPYQDQFNKVVAYVVINDDKYILDGTDLQTPSQLIPFKLLNTVGFIVDRKKSGFINITDRKAKNLDVVNIDGTIEATGVVKATAAVSHYDYAKINKKSEYVLNKKKYEEDFVTPYGFIQIDSFTVSGLQSDSLAMENNFKLNYSLNKSGEYFLLGYNLFTGLDKNPFIADNRFTNIDFGTKYVCLVNETYKLPNNLQVESLPKKIKLVTPESSMSLYREIELKNNSIEINMKFEINKPVYTPNEYELVKEFYKKMFDIIGEPVVLKAR